MNKTANFQLTQWEKTDRIMMEDFNRDNAAIDTALKGNADKAAALQTALAGAGNCSMETQSYTGNGKYGQNNPNTVFCQVCLKNSHLIFYWDSAAYGIIADANFRELAFPVQAGQVLPSGSRGDIQ